MGLFTRSVFAFALSQTMIATIATPAGAQSLVEKGDTLYHNRCAGCHGEQLKAFAGGPAFDLRRLRPDEHDRFAESVISGKVAQEIMDVAASEDAGLIVMGSRGMSDWQGLLIGSVAHKIVHLSSVPVLIVRQPGEYRFRT